MNSAYEMAMGAMRVANLLFLFWPYTLLVTIAFFLLKGKEAENIRSRMVIFTAAIVLGSWFCTLWLALNLSPGSRGSNVTPHDLSYMGTVLTGPVLWRIIPLFVALAGHAAIYTLSGLCALPRRPRNTAASILIGLALLFGVLSPIPQVRYWRTVYNRDTMTRAHELYMASHQATDALTEQWTDTHPDSWQQLLLRADFLYDQGRIDEARQLDRSILELPEKEVPDDLRAVIQKRLSKGYH